MDKKDLYLDLLSKSYEESVEFLLEKYGPVKDDYYKENSYNRFLKGEIKNITHGQYSRTSEGLFCHHIYEFRYENLSNKNYIKQYRYPFELHKSNNLVYCDLFEHAILHVLISKESSLEFGDGGYKVFIRPMIKDWYLAEKKPKFKRLWLEKSYEKAFLNREDASVLLAEMDRIMAGEKKRQEEEKKNDLLRIVEENSYRDLRGSSPRTEIIQAFYSLKEKGALGYENQYFKQVYSEELGINISEAVSLEVFEKNMEDYDMASLVKNINLFIDYKEGKLGLFEYMEESRNYCLTKHEAEKMAQAEKERLEEEKKQEKIEEKKAEEFYKNYPKFKDHGIRHDLKRQEINVLLFKYYEDYKCFIKFQGAMKEYSREDLLDKLYSFIEGPIA